MLHKVAKFVEIKSMNPKIKHSEIAKQLAVSTSTLQPYRREMNMHSHYSILQSSNTHTRKQKPSKPYWAWPQDDLEMTSNYFKKTSKESDISNWKSKLKGDMLNDDNSTEERNLSGQA